LHVKVKAMATEHNERPEWMTVKEAAAYVRLHPGTIYAKAAAGTIPVHRAGGALRFNRAELDAWLRGEWPNLAA